MDKKMKKAIIFGAGSIGRGFIGQIFFQTGLEIIFVDIDKKIVDEINSKNEYPLYLISSDRIEEIMIKNVRAINIENTRAVIDEITDVEIAATAVGANALPAISRVIAEGAVERFKNDSASPLNILICENLLDASGVMRDLLEKNLAGREEILDKIGLVETSIGRSVPTMTEDMQKGNILSVWAEPYCELPVDSKGFVGNIPEINSMVPFTPFKFYKEKKLYIHNLGHSVVSYLGYLYGYKYIWECAADKTIINAARKAMSCSASALSKSYKVPLHDLEGFNEELITRFKNKKLKDTVARGCRDPLRKLGPDDRFIGTFNKCKEQGIDGGPILKAVAAALLYEAVEDEESHRMKELIKAIGVPGFLMEHCLLDEKQARECEEYYLDFLELKE